MVVVFATVICSHRLTCTQKMLRNSNPSLMRYYGVSITEPFLANVRCFVPPSWFPVNTPTVFISALVGYDNCFSLVVVFSYD